MNRIIQGHSYLPGVESPSLSSYTNFHSTTSRVLFPSLEGKVAESVPKLILQCVLAHTAGSVT